MDSASSILGTAADIAMGTTLISALMFHCSALCRMLSEKENYIITLINVFMSFTIAHLSAMAGKQFYSLFSK